MDYRLYWINVEIPAYLARFDSYSAFEKSLPAAGASGDWKAIACGMAKERWNVTTIKNIPR